VALRRLVAGAGSGEEQRGPPLLGTARRPRGDDGAAWSPGRPVGGSASRVSRDRGVGVGVGWMEASGGGWSMGIEDEETASCVIRVRSK
jgi:hypothetical protein